MFFTCNDKGEDIVMCIFVASYTFSLTLVLAVLFSVCSSFSV